MPIILRHSAAVTFAFYRCCIVSCIVAHANGTARFVSEYVSDNARESRKAKKLTTSTVGRPEV